MLTTILLAAALAGAPDKGAAATAEPPSAEAPAKAGAEPAVEPEAGLLEGSSLSEDDLASQAASLTAKEGETAATGEFAPAVQSGMALDRSRIETFTPPKPESTSIPGLGGLGGPTFSSAFGR